MDDTSSPTLLHRLEYFSVRTAGFCLSLLPAALAVSLGGVAGMAVGTLLPLRRGAIRENLRIAFGDSLDRSEKRRLEREAWRTLAMLTVETLLFARRGPEWARSRIVEVEGREHLQAARPTDQDGLISVGGHFGNWELLGAWAGANLPAVAVAKPLHNPLVQDEVVRTRSAAGMEFVWATDATAGRQILRHLRKGHVINFLVDQDMRHNGIFVPFFGRKASTTSAPAAFSLQLGVPILPSFMVRLGPTHHRLVMCPPIRPEDFAHLETKDEKIHAIMESINRTIEDMIRLYPAQYFWFHRRWRTGEEEARARREKRERLRRRRLDKRRASEEAEAETKDPAP